MVRTPFTILINTDVSEVVQKHAKLQLNREVKVVLLNN